MYPDESKQNWSSIQNMHKHIIYTSDILFSVENKETNKIDPTFLTIFSIPVIISSLLVSKNYGPEHVTLCKNTVWGIYQIFSLTFLLLLPDKKKLVVKTAANQINLSVNQWQLSPHSLFVNFHHLAI